MVRWLFPLTLAISCAAAAAEPCRSIDGIDPLLKAGSVVLLGELHGTVESPAFALDLSCHAARAGIPLIVGVELMPGEQARVDAFLDSEGTEEDRAALLAGQLWSREYQDGRNSWAMFDLIDGLRELRGEGSDVRMALFDASGARGGQQRDRDMGRNLAAVVSGAPRSMVLALLGNQHSRIIRGRSSNPEYEPAGYVLAREASTANLVSLNVAHGGGSARICTPDCGIVELRGRHGPSVWTIDVDDATRPAGHTGWYHVGTITAAPPARMSRPKLSAPAPTSKTAPDGPARLPAKVEPETKRDTTSPRIPRASPSASTDVISARRAATTTGTSDTSKSTTSRNRPRSISTSTTASARTRAWPAPRSTGGTAVPSWSPPRRPAVLDPRVSSSLRGR